MFNWVKLEDGCLMPEYDEPVIWKREDGIYIIRAIDKDDHPWWQGRAYCGNIIGGTRFTHWAKICDPEDIPDQDSLWDELVLEYEALERMDENNWEWNRSILKNQFIITKK